MKAYLNHCQITIKTADGFTMSFPAGAAATGTLDDSPYKLLFKTEPKASAILEKLYQSRHLPFEEQMALFAGKAFSVSLESIDEKVLPVVSFKTADDLLVLEILVALAHKRPLKKCENCGQYFFPQGRSDALYCDRIGADGFSCKKIGAHRQYRKNSREDDVKVLYDKLTKHNRYLKNSGKIAERDYDRWMAYASESYAAYKVGDISERTLMTRLTESLTPAARSARGDISDYLL